MKKTSRAVMQLLHCVSKVTFVLALVSAVLIAGGKVAAQNSAPVPATPKKPVVQELHGVKITDDYRWLEDWNDPAVREWSDAQNRAARAYLDGLAVREPIRRWLREISNKSSVTYFSLRSRGDVFFAMKDQPPKTSLSWSPPPP